MKKRCFALMLVLTVLLVMPFSLAAIDFTKEAVSSTIIKETMNPALFNFTIKNNLGIDDFYTIDTQLDFNVQPAGTFKVEANSVKTIPVNLLFSKIMRNQYSGTRLFEYSIKSQQLGLEQDTFEIKIISLKTALEITTPESIAMKDSSTTITIKNREPASLEGIATINSPLAKGTQEISLGPFEQKDITIDLKKEDLWKEAGKYPFTVSLTFDDYTWDIERNVDLKEHKEVVSEDKKTNLLAYQKKYSKKTNMGNVPENVSITMTLSSFAKSFTSYNIQPTSIRQEEDNFVLVWNKELNIGESLEVEVISDFTVPLVIIAALFIIFLLIYLSKKNTVTITKRAIKAVTNTGDFATKVIISVKNRGRDITDVEVSDYLPPLATLHERFGTEKPEVEGSRLQWKIDVLPKGEQKVFSYAIYTKLKFIGSLLIPRAQASYIVNNKQKSMISNEVQVMA